MRLYGGGRLKSIPAFTGGLNQATTAFGCYKYQHLGFHILITQSLFLGNTGVRKCAEKEGSGKQ
ncbi:hypothetical protein DPV78_003764 [Talaromyces pinophilus]|nr:hypothetical protein DPV78_003764 [Talaromyces pinophilus]